MADDLATIGYKADLTGINQINRGLTSVGKTGENTEKKLNKSARGIARGFTTLGGFIGAVVGASAVNQLTSYSDSWTKINNQLRLVTDSEKELIKTRRELLDLSRDTTASAETTVELYAELTRGTKDLNVTQNEVAKVTRTINNLFKAGGKSATETAGAIRQLNQGLAAGALRGDEFNSVAEGAPRILDALAKKLKISRGELRSFAATGGITAKILFSALSDYSGEAQKLADKTTDSFSQMMTVAGTNVTQFTGSNQLLTASTETLGKSIVYLSGNLEHLTDAAMGAAGVYATFATVQGGKALAATVASTAASVKDAKATVASTTATIADTRAELANIEVQKASLAARMAKSGFLTNKAKLDAQMIALTEAQTKAEQRLTAATLSQSAAQKSATVTARALGAATRFMLGPWGLLATALGVAATAFITSKDASDNLNKSLATQAEEVEKLHAKYEKMSRRRFGAQAVDLQKQLIELDQQIIDAESKVSEAKSRTRKAMFGDGRRGDAGDLVAVQESEKALSDLLSKRSELDELYNSMVSFFDSKIPEKWSEVVKTSTKQTQKQIDTYKAWLASVRDAADPTAKLYEEINKVSTAMDKGHLSIAVGAKRIAQLNEEIAEINTTPLDRWIQATIEAADPARALSAEIARVNDAMRTGLISSNVGTKRLGQLGEQLESLNTEAGKAASPFDDIANGALTAMGAMSMMFESGTRDAQALAIAMQSIQLGQAAMSGNMFGAAAAGIGIIASVDQIFSGIKDRTADIQAAQGLNQFGEKAQSIDNSLTIVADSTKDLVGINTDMLSALQNLQVALTGAAGIVARDVSMPGVDVSGKFYDFGKLQSLLGGKSKVADEGVRILGGQINELLNAITVEAYQSVDYKKWRWGKTKTKTAFKAVDDSVSQQFELVFSSLVDSVQTGAAGLGLNQKEVANALGSYMLDTISVSIKGMTVDEQIEAFNNVFSQVFNELAISVVPWLTDLQQAGEDLGETLSRVSTQVSIADLMVERFGVTFGDKLANPEAYAKAADNISMLVGGVESLSSLTSSFIDNFATDEQKLAIHFDALTESLGGVGLLLPETASGMYELMSGLDGTTQAGREQIATLLKVGDTASEYYSMLEKQSEAMSNLSSKLADTVMNIYDVSDGVEQIGLDSALAAARIGDFSLTEGLNLSDYTLDASEFSSAAAFNIAQAEAANKLLELSRLSASAAGDVQVQQLDVLNNINSNIIASMQATTELLAQQNALQAESADSLDRINTTGVRIEQ